MRTSPTAHWKVITSRQEHLSPVAQLVSKLCLAYILLHLLRVYVFPPQSVFPGLLFALMVAAAIAKTLPKMSSRFNQSLKPPHPSSTAAATTAATTASSSDATAQSRAAATTPASSSFFSSFYAQAASSFYTAATSSADRLALLNAIAGMDAYKERTMALIRRRYALFSKMSFHHRQLASEVGYLDRVQSLEPKVLANANLLAEMSKFAKQYYAVKPAEMRVAKPTPNVQIIELLHHFVRDWAPELHAQRAELFRPILQALECEFPESSLSPASSLATLTSQIQSESFGSTSSAATAAAGAASTPPPQQRASPRRSKRVLVPGSGLARLAYEISRMGFQTEALEYSSLMDIAANFLFHFQQASAPLPQTDGRFQLFPYVHDFSHQVNGENQGRALSIPDITPPEYLPIAQPTGKEIVQPSTLKIGYGDFTHLVNNISQPAAAENDDDDPYPNQYDAVVTLFLIDTAENALKYLEAIRALLKPGGVWINYGPLKWGTSPQVEFTLEELELVIQKLGFSIEHKFQGTNEYNGDSLSLWQGLYKIRGWVARKPLEKP